MTNFCLRFWVLELSGGGGGVGWGGGRGKTNIFELNSCSFRHFSSPRGGLEHLHVVEMLVR